MSWTPPGHIDPELWERLPDYLRDGCIQAHEWIEAGGPDAGVRALGVCPFWMIADEFGVMRSDDRADYPQLDDVAFANFRMVATTGIAEGRFYRSSSPFWPDIVRNECADAAARAAGIRSCIDIADDPEQAKRWGGFAGSYCAEQKLLCMHTTMFFLDEKQRALFAEVLRFIAGGEAPFLIFCMEGQDRTGYMCGVIEAFMGASVDEIVADYLATFANYYAVTPGSEAAQVLERFFLQQLADAFAIDDLRQAEVAGTLQQTAEAFVASLGLTEAERAALCAALS